MFGIAIFPELVYHKYCVFIERKLYGSVWKWI